MTRRRCRGELGNDCELKRLIVDRRVIPSRNADCPQVSANSSSIAALHAHKAGEDTQDVAGPLRPSSPAGVINIITSYQDEVCAGVKSTRPRLFLWLRGASGSGGPWVSDFPGFRRACKARWLRRAAKSTFPQAFSHIVFSTDGLCGYFLLTGLMVAIGECLRSLRFSIARSGVGVPCGPRRSQHRSGRHHSDRKQTS